MTTIGVLAHSRKRLGDGLGALRSTLAAHGVADPVWREVPRGRYVARAAEELLEAGVDLLFVWGGDGTLRRCIEAIGDAPVALAILPAGTANLLAGNLGIPTDLERAVAIGMSGHRKKLDLGTVNGERFAVMAGIGFDARIMHAADDDFKERLGRGAYLAAGLRNVRREGVHMRIKIDGMTWFRGAATCVLVGNMGETFAGITPFPDASPEDGRLNVGTVTATGAVEWARTLARTMIGSPSSSPFVETISATEIDVKLGKKLPYELDGDTRPQRKKLRFRVQPAAITVCVPLRGEEK